MEKYQESYSKKRCCTGHDYMCNQCHNFKMTDEMADEMVCEECVQQLREFNKVDLKQLLTTMQDEDIEEVKNKIKFEELDNELDKAVKAATMGEKDGLRDVLVDIIERWYHNDDSYEELAEEIINLIKQ